MRITIITLLAACGPLSSAENWQDWYDPGSAYDVEEPVEFTTDNYDFTGTTAIADLPRPGDFETWFAPDDAPPTPDCSGWSTSSTLPAEITGIVTIHPRYYIKVSGCLPPDDFSVDSDEKYYGSYFVQDSSGGFFVLGDSKVAHFDMGDRVTIKVRAIKEYFDNVMISAHDVTGVERGPEAIYYREVAGRLLTSDDVAQVVRVSGTVAAPMGDFGEVYLCTGDDPDTRLAPDPARNDDLAPACAHQSVDSPPWFKVGIDVELQRRGFSVTPGEVLEVTGPVALSFRDFQLSVLRTGQVSRFTVE